MAMRKVGTSANNNTQGFVTANQEEIEVCEVQEEPKQKKNDEKKEV